MRRKRIDVRPWLPTINAIKEMYERHDESERALVIATRRGRRTKELWDDHDLLERAIVLAESTLPPLLAERLKDGEL